MKHLMQPLMGLGAVLAVVVGATAATAAPDAGEHASAATKHAPTASGSANAQAVANPRVSNAPTTTQNGLDRILGEAGVPAWSPAVQAGSFNPGPSGMLCTGIGCDQNPSVCTAEGQVCSGCIMDVCYPAY